MQDYTLEKLLILAKTYPNPSTKYRETTCVAAISDQGGLRRVYPVPFRFLDGSRQFRKWEWISARLTSPSDDRRPESRRMDADSIIPLDCVGTEQAWRLRRELIAPHVVSSFEALEQARLAEGRSLGILHVGRLMGLEIVPERSPQWTPQELARLEQDGLFDIPSARRRQKLRKLPYRFYYRYEISTANGIEQHRHMITDWEVGALYWNCWSRNGDEWENPFRAKLEHEFGQKDLFLLIGTMHRFPDQWLIISLIYPPRLIEPPPQAQQLGLGLGQ